MISLLAPAIVTAESQELIPHAPITINGNAGFTNANGVVSGSGTPSEPYVIEGWEISNNANPGILISGTTAHFVIRGLVIQYAGDIPSEDLERAIFLDSTAKDGIVLQNVRNGIIQDSRVSFSHYAIRLNSSSNVNITGNRMENIFSGILILRGSNNLVHSNSINHYLSGAITVASSNNVIHDNLVSHGGFCWGNPVIGCFLGYGITVDSWNNSIVRNLVLESNYLGIYIVGADRTAVLNNTLVRNAVGMRIGDSRNVSIENNRMSEGGDGILIFFGSNHTIRGNWIVGNWHYGIVLLVTSHHTVQGNIVDGSRRGMWLQRAVYNTITGNSLTNNEVGIFLCLEIYGNRLAPPVNDFSGTQQPILHCNRGNATPRGGSSAEML